MNFLYNTVSGRIFLKLLLHAKMLNLCSRWLHSPYSKWIIRPYIKKNKINMQPFQGQKYKSFADFFARKTEDRCYVKNPNMLISPCDGKLSIALIKKDIRFRVKNSLYSIYDLVPDSTIADFFKNGLCMIFRLSADDYHHFCYIDDCYHRKGRLIPGTLHSVQPIALEKEPVFQLNKRMWSIMDTQNFGLVAQIEVGAVLVGGIVHEVEDTRVKRGAEMGHFELCGSTVILLFQNKVKEKFRLFKEIEEKIEIGEEYQVKMGEAIGYVDTDLFMLVPLKKECKRNFINDMQEAFQIGAEEKFGKMDAVILPEKDIMHSLAQDGAAAYQAMLDGEIVGGAVVVINEKTKCNHLDFLYVKYGYQGNGIGKKIWDTLEALYPDTVVWETVTPYFEKRNLHFYINRCGFHAVEFYHPKHMDYHATEDIAGEEYFFRFEKKIISS